MIHIYSGVFLRCFSYPKMLKNLKHYIRLKRLGFIGDQLGIAHRYHTEGTGWSHQLSKTGSSIISSLKDNSKSRIAILGSGWLLDIPLEKILQLVDHIYLVDINHPKPIRHKWENNSKITFIETDVTGGGTTLFWNILKGKIDEAEALKIALELKAGLDIPTVDLTFSVNILSQLAHIPAESVKDHNKLSPGIASQLVNRIQQNHLEWLQSRNGILIADFEEELYDEEDLLCGVNQLCFISPKEWQQVDRWRWKFDSHMTYRSDFKTYLQVGLFHPVTSKK